MNYRPRYKSGLIVRFHTIITKHFKRYDLIFFFSVVRGLKLQTQINSEARSDVLRTELTRKGPN